MEEDEDEKVGKGEGEAEEKERSRTHYNNVIIRSAAPVFCSSCRIVLGDSAETNERTDVGSRVKGPGVVCGGGNDGQGETKPR